MYAPHIERRVDADLASDCDFVFGVQELIRTQFTTPGELIGLSD